MKSVKQLNGTFKKFTYSCCFREKRSPVKNLARCQVTALMIHLAHEIVPSTCQSHVMNNLLNDQPLTLPNIHFGINWTCPK